MDLALGRSEVRGEVSLENCSIRLADSRFVLLVY